MDRDRIEKAVKDILIGVGEDPGRQGLVKTPAPTILAITTNVAVRAPIRPNPWDAGSFMAESPTTAA